MDGEYFADAYVDRILFGQEAPRQAASDIGVEAHRNGAAERPLRRRGRDLRTAAEASRAAEPVVERDCRIGRADHRVDEHAARRGDWSRLRVVRTLYGDLP